MAHYFTFMIKQGPIHNFFIKIDEADADQARQKMFTEFGQEWAFQYPEYSYQDLLDHGMTEISIKEAHAMLDREK